MHNDNIINMKLTFRKAIKADVQPIIEMLADDELGSQRESFQVPLPQSYVEAFEAIDKDRNQELIVVEAKNEIIGTLQLSFIQYLTYQGGIRAQIEAVRIGKAYRDQGFGARFFQWAIERAKERKAHVLQLTTDKQRPDAVRFYENLGFKASHEGMKLHF